MPFALDSNPSQGEISEAINYLLANFGSNLVADPNTGLITGPSGTVIAYLYQYLAIKYADSADGASNFSNSPTNRQYYGVRNTSTSAESTNPADYIWYKVAGGFGTTKYLFYQVSGGRQINFYVGTAAPDATYLQDSGTAIDLDIITTSSAYNTAAPSIYKWTSSSTPPSRPATTSTYTWATGAYTAPTGWTTEPAINTTPGSYLWAITIPLVVSSATTTSTLDWTNTSYQIYVAGLNGADGAAGTPGANGLSSITAYLAQSQSSPAPSTPSNTSGPTAPPGWSLTAPSVSVGDVLWYSFGQYNSSSGTINGVPAGQTQWGTPTAASVFQDIRSDNWNGSTPPVAGTPATYGSAGYYIQRSTGNVYLNSVYGRGVAQFDGSNSTSAGSAALQANSSASQKIGLWGLGGTGGYGVYGIGGDYGVYGLAGNISAIYANGQSVDGIQAATYGSTAYGAYLVHSNSAYPAAYLWNGTLKINNSTLVTNLNADLLDGQHASSFLSSTGTAYAADRLNGSAGLNVLRFVQGTVTGSSSGIYIGTNKPGSSSNNTWIQINIDGSTFYIPVWS